jgi:hypothetical protein
MDREARDALADLRRWARATARRDLVVRNALIAGVSVREIHRVSGIARTTVMRIREEMEKGTE